MQDLADDEVMQKYQEGEPAAMDELLRRYKNPLYHFALRLILNAAEAQDITQEVFLRLHQCKEGYRPKGKFAAWLFNIAHNLCISRFRKRKWYAFWPRIKDAPDESVEFESPGPSPRDVAQDNDLSCILKKCIQGLPLLQKEALILREYENLDYHEIAKILQKPQATVKILLYRARQNLKAKLFPYLEELGGGLL